MEKAARVGVRAGKRRESVPRACALAVLALAAGPAAAQEPAAAPAPVVVAQADLRVQLRTSTLPALDGQESTPRVDLSVTPMTRKGNGLGAVLGLETSPSVTGGVPGLQPRNGVDLGLRWSQRILDEHRIDITAWRRLNAPEDAYTLTQMGQPMPVYGARVELNLSAAHKSGLAMAPGFLGFQMESGARITVKRKDGRPMVYYRTTF